MFGRMQPCVTCQTAFSPTSATNVCCSRECSRALRGDFTTRFWARVDKKGPVVAGMTTCCWLRTGRLEKNGYARVKKQNSRNQVSVHRAAWEMKHGEVPRGMQVLHRCDIRNCVRHLFLGTAKDNTQDMLCKGRANKAGGSRAWQVQAVREECAQHSAFAWQGMDVGKTFFEVRGWYNAGEPHLFRRALDASSVGIARRKEVLPLFSCDHFPSALAC